jgi:hypothetical protein
MVKKIKTSKRQNRQNQSLHSAPNPVSYVQPRTKIERFRLTGEDFVVSSGGGIINYSLPIDPTGLGVEWSSLSSLYGEFRVIGGMITIADVQPIITSGSSVQNGLAIIAFDAAEFYTPSAVGDLFSYSNRAEFQARSLDRKPFKYGFTFPMAGSDTAILWHSTSVAFTPQACVLIAANTLGASATYWTVLYDFYVQFRTRY